MDDLISKKEKLIKIPHIEGIKCFGCGHSNPVGLKMDFYADETVVYSWLTLAVMTNMPMGNCGNYFR
jgi:Icc-related predicted phosphoesterase